MSCYIAMIKDETTVAQWALVCARAFGALVHMRDESLDKPVPERVEPSVYHGERIARAREKIASLEAMSEEERERTFLAHRKDAIEARSQVISSHDAELARLKRMRRRVEEWQPPAAYTDLKRFMLEQLNASVERVPCLSDDEDAREPLYPSSSDAWWKSELTNARQALSLAEECQRREEDRCRRANEWLSGLRRSLAEFERGEPTRLFHDHLESCPRCSERPFDLCPVGNEILVSSVLAVETPRFMSSKP